MIIIKNEFIPLLNMLKIHILPQGESMRDDVLVRINERLNVLAALPTLKNGSIGEALKKSGFSRRDFMKWAGAMTAFMALPASMAPTVG